MAKRLRRLCAGLLALGLLALALPVRALTVSVTYPPCTDELINPYIGNAVWATDPGTHEQPFTLVYASLLWADFEPQEGVYDFAAFEAENQFSRWRAEGKRLIFRFVMDEPTGKKHHDIPDWLYEATDGDGKNYTVPYGRGFSPNYANETLIRAHAAAIAALGERYGSDPFVAYIELGSIGHWGEWHIYTDIGAMPPGAVSNRYVRPYLSAFPGAYLLMRRPFAIAAENGLGLFNDTAGDRNPTEVWLDWISAGGVYETQAGDEALVPMANAWQTAPIGGELSSAIARETLLDGKLDQTLSLFRQSHTSWIGPGSFVDIPRGSSLQAALDTVNRTVGYRLRISRCDVRETGDDLTLTLHFTNDGIAPFYFPWQPTLAVTDARGNQTRYPLALHLADVLPGVTATASLTLTGLDTQTNAYTLSVAIVDPATGEAGVALAMRTQENSLWYELVRLGEE